MLLSRRARELTLSVVLFALPVVLLYDGIGKPSRVNLVDRVVLRVSGAMQRAVHAGFGSVGNLYHRHVALWDQEKRNAALRQENFELRENNRILRSWAAKGLELEVSLGFAPSAPLRTHPADVVGQRLSPFFHVVRVRARPGQVPRPGQAVGIPSGLVGRVQRVSGQYADVLLLSDPQSRVKVLVQRTASRAELNGTGTPGLLSGRVEYISARDEVFPGDRLVTSGMAGRFPRDLPVGSVLRVGRRYQGRYQEVEVLVAAGDDIPTLIHLLRTSEQPPFASPPIAVESR